MESHVCRLLYLFFRDGSANAVSDTIICGSDISNFCALDHSCGGKIVLCKACDKYLELLDGELHPVQSEQDNEQDINLGKVGIRYAHVANWKEERN